jgi:UDP:flavonoid glycosyltransferase YjiC (YdhE family)
MLERLRDRIISNLSLRELGKGLPQFNAARQKLGLDPVNEVFDQVKRVSRVLVLTSPALELPGGPLPANVRYTGPVLVDPPWTKPWAGPWPTGDRDPLVLVGLSTTFPESASGAAADYRGSQQSPRPRLHYARAFSGSKSFFCPKERNYLSIGSP